MELLPIEQAFYDLYTKEISECPKEYVMEFLSLEKQIYPNWDEFPIEYYTHLKDTLIAFYAGFELGREINQGEKND